ncbi:hypothetical protein C8Q76DRAFT_791064 [Earliella scabrosa]|nr:hypothetical protein C8Q76DRAFT_791064 [Earliella scabrosa]
MSEDDTHPSCSAEASSDVEESQETTWTWTVTSRHSCVPGISSSFRVDQDPNTHPDPMRASVTRDLGVESHPQPYLRIPHQRSHRTADGSPFSRSPSQGSDVYDLHLSGAFGSTNLPGHGIDLFELLLRPSWPREHPPFLLADTTLPYIPYVCDHAFEIHLTASALIGRRQEAERAIAQSILARFTAAGGGVGPHPLPVVVAELATVNPYPQSAIEELTSGWVTVRHSDLRATEESNSHSDPDWELLHCLELDAHRHPVSSILNTSYQRPL